jgi:hypothetical protein
VSRHTCGAAGGRILGPDGQETSTPCRQGTAVGKRCGFHRTDAAGRRLLALKGGIASRMRSALPASMPEPPFTSPESIVAWSQRMAHAALTQNVDPRRMAEARGFAHLALAALNARIQAQLVEALLRVEHGGAALVLLERLRGGLADGPRRPLPGRVLTAAARSDGS